MVGVSFDLLRNRRGQRRRCIPVIVGPALPLASRSFRSFGGCSKRCCARVRHASFDTAGSESSSLLHLDPQPANRSRRVFNGAVIGGIVGAAAGAIASGYLPTGCLLRGGACGHRNISVRIWGGALGLATGSAAGATVGALIPNRMRR